MNRHLCLRSLALLDEHAVAELEAFGQVLRQILVEGKAESLFRKRQKQGMRLFFFLLRKLRLRGKCRAYADLCSNGAKGKFLHAAGGRGLYRG